jgi:hypothetical protein
VEELAVANRDAFINFRNERDLARSAPADDRVKSYQPTGRFGDRMLALFARLIADAAEDRLTDARTQAIAHVWTRGSITASSAARCAGIVRKDFVETSAVPTGGVKGCAVRGCLVSPRV